MDKGERNKQQLEMEMMLMNEFRAWDIENKRWMTPVIEDVEESEIRLDLWGNIEFTLPWYQQDEHSIVKVLANTIFHLMQFIGLKDLNGDKIFVNDIVTIDDYINGPVRARVTFKYGAFGFVGIDGRVSDLVGVGDEWDDDFISAVHLMRFYGHPDDTLLNVVINGNIHENPDLLKI